MNNTFIGIGERGVILIRPGNEVDSQVKECGGRSVRLTLTENLTVKKNIFVLSGVVDETMLYQVSGQGVEVKSFDHSDNSFFNQGRDIPIGGVADPNKEQGFSKDNPQLPSGIGNDYRTWMSKAQPALNSTSHDRGVQ